MTLTLIRSYMRSKLLLRHQNELLRTAQQLLDEQHATIEDLRAVIKATAEEIQVVHLNHLRNMHGLIASWLIHHEQPELDMRDELTMFEADLAHQIAGLEEHVL